MIGITNKKLISVFRDQFLRKRNKLIKELVEERQVKLFFVYAESDNIDCAYNLCVYSADNSKSEIMTVLKKDLPDRTEIGTALKIIDSVLVIDDELTMYLDEKILLLAREVMLEQEEYYLLRRVEGHHYELIEIGDGEVTLLDLDNHEIQECFDETEFLDVHLDDVEVGEVFLYIDGSYVREVDL